MCGGSFIDPPTTKNICMYIYIYLYIYIYIYIYIHIYIYRYHFGSKLFCSLFSSQLFLPASSGAYLLPAVPSCFRVTMADRKDSMECTECGVEQVVPIPINNPHVVRYCVRMLPSRCTACCTCPYHMCQRDGCNNRNCDECLLHRIVVSTYGFLYGHIVNYHYF